MPKLKCGVDNCFYHYEQYCTRDRIKVAGHDATSSLETCCSNYKRRRNDYDFEAGSFDTVSEYLSISCECENCIYNSNLICKATNIKISGADALNKYETECETFVPRHND